MSLLSKIIGINRLTSGNKPSSTPVSKSTRTTAAVIALGIAGAAVFPGAAAAAARFLIPKSTAGKVAAGLILPGIVAGVVSHPESIGKSAGALYDFEKTSVNIASGNQSLAEGGMSFIKEHPVASSIAGAAGVLAIGKTAVPAVTGYLSASATRANTEAMLNNSPAPVGGNFPITEGSPVSPVSAQELPEGIQPQGSEPKPKTRRKSRQGARSQTISQRVDVRVGVNAANKKYIRESIYA